MIPNKVSNNVKSHNTKNVKGPKKNIYKGRRSCHNCQKAKQRCDMERDVIRRSPLPQPEHLACHRCKVLKLPCMIDLDPETSAAQITSTFNHAESRDVNDSSSPREVYAANLHSRWKAKEPGYNDSRFHVFDPQFKTDGFERDGTKSARFHSKGSSTVLQHTPVMDVAEKLQSMRPFQYLYRLCSIQPEFLSSSINDVKDAYTLEDILIKHSSFIDWSSMEMHLKDYQFFLPFLDSFGDISQRNTSDDLYLATKIYLASLRTEHIDLVADIHVFIRKQSISCILRGPSTTGEASALTALAIYEPLIVARSVDEMQLDGSGLLAASSVAIRALNLERLPLFLQEYTAFPDQDPTHLLTQCSVWITTAFISTLNNLAGSVLQRPILECTLDQLDIVERFCRKILQTSNKSSHWIDQVSLSILQIFRHRALIRFRDIVCSRLMAMEKVPVPNFSQAEALLVEGIQSSYSLAKEVLKAQQVLCRSLSLPARTRNMLMDYMEFEIAQLHMFSIIHFTECCLVRIATHYGRPMDLATLVNQMKFDQTAIQFAGTVINFTKRDMSRKLLCLFSNFTSRWFAASTEIEKQQRIVPFALPPPFICSMMLINVKTMADFTGAFTHQGIYPQDCLDDCEAGMTVCLCRTHADALRNYADQSKDLYLAKGHGDFYQMTADIALRTSNAIHEWAAGVKGIRVHSDTGLESHHRSVNTHQQASSSTSSSSTLNGSSMQSIPDSIGQDFDHLLEQILSTPIPFM